MEELLKPHLSRFITHNKLDYMADQIPKKSGSLLKTVIIGLLIIFGIALLVGTLTVLFP